MWGFEPVTFCIAVLFTTSYSRTQKSQLKLKLFPHNIMSLCNNVQFIIVSEIYMCYSNFHRESSCQLGNSWNKLTRVNLKWDIKSYLEWQFYNNWAQYWFPKRYIWLIDFISSCIFVFARKPRYSLSIITWK